MSNAHQVNITIPISLTLEKRLKEVAKIRQKSAQELILEAVEYHLEQFEFVLPKTCYDLAIELGVVGVCTNLPSDLSTNPKYFEGFGGS